LSIEIAIDFTCVFIMIELKGFMNIAAYSSKTRNGALRLVHGICAGTCHFLITLDFTVYAER